MHDRTPQLTLLDAWDGIQVFLTGPVIAAGAVPGLLICAPGIIFFLIVPLVLTAILLSLIAILLSLAAAPFLIVRAIVSRAHRRRTSRRSAGYALHRTARRSA